MSLFTGRLLPCQVIQVLCDQPPLLSCINAYMTFPPKWIFLHLYFTGREEGGRSGRIHKLHVAHSSSMYNIRDLLLDKYLAPTQQYYRREVDIYSLYCKIQNNEQSTFQYFVFSSFFFSSFFFMLKLQKLKPK